MTHDRPRWIHIAEQSPTGGALIDREVILVKLYVDTTGKQVTVSKPTEPKNDQNGSQRSEKGTGRLMWTTQVIVLDETGGEVIAITTAGEKPNVTVGQLVAIEQLEAIPWATNGRNGVAFRAVSLKPLASPSSK
jgi:hypothetical protein